MRLPTKEEYAAFESEEIARHFHCDHEHGCDDKAPLKSLAKLLEGSKLLRSVFTSCVENNRLALLVDGDIRYAYVCGMLDGLLLGKKLAEQDALTKLVGE
jgi:hypothetical protein